MILLISYSFLFGGCVAIELPDSLLCVANAQSQQLGCYNLKKDYEIDEITHQLMLKPTAKKTYLDLKFTSDVDKYTCIDPDSWEKIVAFLNEAQVACEKDDKND